MSGFVPNKLVQECIENNNIKGLKGAFVGIIFSDRRFSSKDFENTLNHILKKTDLKILEDFDGGELFSKKAKSGNITEDDFEEAVYGLKVNFCNERIEDVKRLSEVLYGKNTKTQGTRSSNEDRSSVNGKNHQGYQQNRVNSKEKSKTGLVVAGLVTAAAIAVAVGFIVKSMK